jgi:exosortase
MTSLCLPANGLPGITRPRRWARIALLMLCTAAIAVGWASTLGELWLRWLPAWRDEGSLMHRLTSGEGYYHHGPLVPLLCAALAMTTCRRLRQTTGRRWWTDEAIAWRAAGLGVLLLATLLHLVGTGSGVNVLRGLALVAAVVGAIGAVGGRDMLRAYAPAAALLIFMVPLPMLTLAHLSATLKLLAAEAGVGLVQLLPGPTLSIDGAIVSWTRGTGIEWMTIDSACSGLRGMMTMSWFAAVLITFGGGWRRALTLALLCLPIAFAANLFRIGLLVTIARQFSPEMVGADTPAHAMIGLLSGGLGIAALCGIDRMFTRVSPAFNGPANSHHRPARWPAVAAIGLLGASALLSAAVTSAAPPTTAVPSWRALPSQVSINGARFIATDVPVDQASRETLGQAVMVHRRYLDIAGQRGFDLLIVWHPTDGSAIHPPDICLTGGGATMSDRQATADRVVARVGNDTAAMNVLFSYFDGRGLTSQYTAMRLGAIGPSANGYALIRLTASTADRNGLTRHDLTPRRRPASAACA